MQHCNWIEYLHICIFIFHFCFGLTIPVTPLDLPLYPFTMECGGQRAEWSSLIDSEGPAA
jgi:hypothetical protein